MSVHATAAQRAHNNANGNRMATDMSDQRAITSSRELQQIKTRQNILPRCPVLRPPMHQKRRCSTLTVFNFGSLSRPLPGPRPMISVWRSLTITITITAFERSPDGGRGLARDTRVRWALEEVAQPYEVRLVSFHAMKEPRHLALHPFGQIPTYEEGDLALFETGAIVFHVAERHAGLLPDDANARARAITWMFAALNTVEPPILELANARLLESGKPWSAQRMPLVKDRVRNRLRQLSRRL